MKLREGHKSLRFEIDVWWNETDQSIHMASTDAGIKGFHTTANMKEGKARCHPNLFKKLAEVLTIHGKPAPEKNPRIN